MICFTDGPRDLPVQDEKLTEGETQALKAMNMQPTRRVTGTQHHQHGNMEVLR